MWNSASETKGWKRILTSDIRKLKQSDIAQVVRIEKNCFPNPWEASTFLTILVSQGVKFRDLGFILMNVICEDDEIEGYVVWSEITEKYEGRILNIAIKKERRRIGLGKKLLSIAFESMQKEGITSCTLEVRVSNQSAKSLYEKMGMKAFDRVHNYYESEDAIIYKIDW
ncbi:MAG: ribosomal protein S18-alanine N-acetyltransferase [Candidatus Thorarchaeota archaeon]